VQLGGGLSYTTVERKAVGGYSAARQSSFDGYFSPGIGASYGISEHWSLLALISGDFYFETVTGIFLTARLGVQFHGNDKEVNMAGKAQKNNSGMRLSGKVFQRAPGVGSPLGSETPRQAMEFHNR